MSARLWMLIAISATAALIAIVLMASRDLLFSRLQASEIDRLRTTGATFGAAKQPFGFTSSKLIEQIDRFPRDSKPVLVWTWLDSVNLKGGTKKFLCFMWLESKRFPATTIHLYSESGKLLFSVPVDTLQPTGSTMLKEAALRFEEQPVQGKAVYAAVVSSSPNEETIGSVSPIIYP